MGIIIAFLYYSGSLYFLFISIIFLSIIACFFEYLAFRLSYNNLIFSSLISQIIAFRYIHFDICLTKLIFYLQQ